MSIFSRKETRAAEVATDAGSDRILRGLLRSADEMTAEKAMNIPAVASSVNFISSIIAMLPIKLYRENPDHTQTEEIRTDERLKLLNEETGDLLSSYQMKRALIRDYLLNGAGYVYVRHHGNRIVSLNYVDSEVVSVSKDYDPISKDARIFITGGCYYPHEFVIMARNTRDGVTGAGIVAENPEMLTGIYNVIVFEKQLIRNGGSRKGFLESERKLSEDEMRILREKWEQLYADYSNGVMILNNGIKFVQASSSSVELQLNENKQTNSRLVYSLFNLSEAVVTGTANDEQNSAAVKVAVIPIIKELEAAINRACLLESEKERCYFAFDVTELLKGDILKRYQAYQTGLSANFLQPDEVRYKEDLPPLGLDFIKLGLNDVLYNPKTKEIYTPNTNQTARVADENGTTVLQSEEKSGIIQEERFNPNHDEKGRFASGNGASGTKYAPSPRRNSGGITVKPKTYAMLCGEFNTLYPNSRKGETGLISKGKYRYMAVSDGEGGIILHAKWKQK